MNEVEGTNLWEGWDSMVGWPVRVAIGAVLLSSLAVASARAGGAAGIWTIQDENASVSTSTPTDRYYVNGFDINWVSPEGDVPAGLANFDHAVWGDGAERISIGVEQQIFTPDDTAAINPPTDDEPYAGYLAATFDLIHDTATTRSVLGAAVGVVGRDAGAEIVQNDFHSIIGQRGTHGWAYQLPSEPAADLAVARIWRVRLADFGNGLQVDALPQLAGMAGLTRVYGEPAVGFRIGEGLDSDFGPSLLAPAPSGTDAYAATRPLVWYLYGSGAAQIIGHDEFLQGSDFQTSRSVNPYRVVGTFEVGAAVIWRGLRFSYTQVFQTRRFHGQVGSLHQYGSFALSASF